MSCRPHCGACCIYPSISSPIPGMEQGKPANVPCPQLGPKKQCLIFDQPNRPKVCHDFLPYRDVCGDSFLEAKLRLVELEQLTSN
ncbi:MAG: YkgJ family cysteine cluster protein [Gammaproteobacteria bacterium]|nr:YkgJ family cysteine cluster protein [Gammaproteobacteria bacterium]MDH5799878.1 YkgJ family cysteine cluster protein [Gammaproteobacteria bacterium]